jgi:hypothetical protein
VVSRRATLIGLVAMMVIALPAGMAGARGAASARGDECSALPTSARRPWTCSPRAECQKMIGRDLAGPALAAARADCERLPTSGTCYGPETYNPQAECRARQKR